MSLDLEERLDESLTDSGQPKYAHYAESVSVTEGYVLGTPVVAICGEVFIPSRDPKKFPICPICKQIAESLYLDQE
jgi:hypothetical protein